MSAFKLLYALTLRTHCEGESAVRSQVPESRLSDFNCSRLAMLPPWKTPSMTLIDSAKTAEKLKTTSGKKARRSSGGGGGKNGDVQPRLAIELKLEASVRDSTR